MLLSLTDSVISIKKATVVRIKATGTQTEQNGTQTVYVESESVKEAEERLGMITSDEYTISNWADISEKEESDSDDEFSI